MLEGPALEWAVTDEIIGMVMATTYLSTVTRGVAKVMIDLFKIRFNNNDRARSAPCRRSKMNMKSGIKKKLEIHAHEKPLTIGGT